MRELSFEEITWLSPLNFNKVILLHSLPFRINGSCGSWKLDSKSWVTVIHLLKYISFWDYTVSFCLFCFYHCFREHNLMALYTSTLFLLLLYFKIIFKFRACEETLMEGMNQIRVTILRLLRWTEVKQSLLLSNRSLLWSIYSIRSLIQLWVGSH